MNMRKASLHGAALIFLAVLLWRGIAAAEVPGYTLWVDGQQTEHLHRGTASAAVRFAAEKSADAMLCGAVYNGSGLAELKTLRQRLLPGENTLELNGINVGAESTSMKLMLWEAETMVPLTEPVVVSAPEPRLERFAVTLGNREYTAYIDEKHHTVSLMVPLYSIKGNTQTVPITSGGSYQGTPSPEAFQTQIRSVTPKITLGEGAVLDSGAAHLDLTQNPVIAVKNPDTGVRAEYTVSVDAVTVQRDTDLRGRKELVTPLTTTYNAGQNLRRHNAPLAGTVLGSGIWTMENFAFQSLNQISYDPAADRTADTPGYHTAEEDGLRMTKDRDGVIALLSTESNAPKGNLTKTITRTAFTVQSMSGDGLEVYFGENRFVLRAVPAGETCRLWLGIEDRWEDTGCDIALGTSYELQCVTQELEDRSSRGTLYLDGKWIYTMDAAVNTVHKLNRYHVKYQMLENTRGVVLLENWCAAYQLRPADLGTLYPVRSVIASGDDGNGPEHVLDRDYRTRWSAKGSGAYITLELEQTVPVAYIGAAFYQGSARQYEIGVQSSVDGLHFTDVIEGYQTQLTQDMQAIDLGGIYQARYLRILCYGNTMNSWNSITELSVYAPYESGGMPVAQDGPETASGLRNLTPDQQETLRRFDRKFARMYLWLANLYDPETGGFYMARSGADDPAQEPALEMTFFALNAVKSSSDCWGALPEAVKNRFIQFIVDRQDPETGLFIDRQGPVNARETARNQSAVMSWVNQWDIQLPYPHPGQKSAAQAAAAGKLRTAYRQGTKTAAAADILPDYLDTPESYRAWIESWDWDKNSWTAGDQLGNSLVYLRYMEDGYDVYRQVVLDWLAERQFADTGLWAPSIDFNSISGAFKVGLVYAGLGEQIPNARKVMESTLTCMRTDTPTVAHYMRNPLSVLRQIADYGPEYADAIQKAVLENMETIISWMDIFLCPDGGFSQYEKKSMGTFGGVAGSHQLWEGDVDSTVMLLTARREVYSLAGISPPELPAGEDFWRWISGTEAVPSPYLDPKYENVSLDSFEAEEDLERFAAGTVLDGTELGGSRIGDTLSASIVRDAQRDSNVLALSYDAGQASETAGPSFRIQLGSDIGLVRYIPVTGTQTVVVECEIKCTGAASNNFYISYGNSAYMLSFGGSGNQRLGTRVDPVNVNYEGTYAVLEADVWHKLRIAYTRGTGRADFLCRVYLDDVLVSENPYFYNCLQTGAQPADAYGKLGITWYKAGRGTVYFDHFRTYKTEGA